MGKTVYNIKPSYIKMFYTYLSFFILLITGHIRDQLGKIFIPWQYRCYFEYNGLPTFFTTFDSFYIRRLYMRISDCWNRPIHGVPGRKIKVLERISSDHNKTFKFTGQKLDLINVGSYNYLGFAINKGKVIDSVLESVDAYPLNYSFPLNDYNINSVTKTLEKELAEFLHQEDAAVFSMGYGINTSAIPILMENSLIFSDEFNHMSIIKGMKLSKSKIVIYRHNDMEDLEEKLKHYIAQGVPESRLSWEKIFVVVEGIFSMEGTIIDLRSLIELKRIYKFYIYMDEAHSIGAMGNTGRGICEYFGIDFSDVDILMGTFSKSFGAFGGYLAAKKEIIDYVRNRSDFYLFGEQMSPICATQILSSLRLILADTSRLKRLQQNTRNLRRMLKKAKFSLIGHDDSPVIPILIYSPGKIGDFSRLCLDNGVAVVVVGYPATPLMLSRVRLCASASHTDEDIEKIVNVIDRVGGVLGLKN